METQSCPQGRQEWEGAGKCGLWMLRRELSKCHCLRQTVSFPSGSVVKNLPAMQETQV